MYILTYLCSWIFTDKVEYTCITLTCSSKYVYIPVYTLVNVYLPICVYVRIHANIRVYVNIYLDTSICAYT